MIEGLSLKLLRDLRFLPKSFYFFFNRIARYAQSKEVEIFLVKFRKSHAKQFLEIAFNHFEHYWVLLLKDVENSIILLVIIAIFENKRK